MRPPAVFAATVTRDRASAGRTLAHQRATVGFPATPAQLAHESMTRRRREAQSRRASEAASAAWRRQVDRTLAPAVAAGRAADKRLRECLDKTREEMILRDGDPPSASPARQRKLNPAELERAVRQLMDRTGLGYFAARKAIEEGR